MFGAGFAAMAATAALSLFAAPVAAQATVDPIVIKGNHLFYKTNGSEFYIKGVAYQQDVGGNSSTNAANTNFVDPLVDHSGCDRDVPLLGNLNTNTIRVYAIDTTQDHSYCMNLLAERGIYLIADLSAPNVSINRDAPEWNMELYTRYSAVIDTLSNYTNVIGFFAGNEVANNASNVDSIAFVKAAARDMKAYIKSKNLGRDLYVGYASDDDSTIRTDLESYLNCGPTTDDNVDFFGYNIYSWCDPSTYSTSGYDARTAELANYSIPAFFAEYGCNTNTRTFQETAALFGDNMTGVWSGGIVYEYFQEANNYGLVSVDGNTASTLSDYNAYQTAIAAVSPTILNTASYSPTNTALRSCPAVGANWDASPTLPPTPNNQLCECMVSSLSCVAKDSVSTDSYGPLFNYICGRDGSNLDVDCSGINGNGSSGVYGAYSMCSLNQRLSWAFNEYASNQSSSNGQACNFGGNATSQSSRPASSCAALVSQAGGVVGTGTSTAIPSNGGSGSGSGSGGSAQSSSHSAAHAVTIPSFDTGLVKLGAYVVFAMFAGAGVVLL